MYKQRGCVGQTAYAVLYEDRQDFSFLKAENRILSVMWRHE